MLAFWEVDSVGCQIRLTSLRGQAKRHRDPDRRNHPDSVVDPFTRWRVEIRAPLEGFVREYGFDIPKLYSDAP
jgi:hypothetical protein